MGNTILTEDAAGLRVITLNRPDKLNSFNDEMHLAFRDALQAASDDETCRALIITGAGKGFCAGQDLGDRNPAKMDGPPDLGHTLATFYAPNIRLIRAMQKPVIAAVNGVAAGAGANIAIACDIVLAAESAKFIQSFAKVGLVPDAGGTWSLSRLIGPARAKGLAMTAEPLSARKAEDWGLIWKTFPDDQLMNEAISLGGKFAEGPTYGLALQKQAFEAAMTNTFDEQLGLEAELQRKAGRSPDYGEGVSSFLEKRPAKFTGKAPK